VTASSPAGVPAASDVSTDAASDVSTDAASDVSTAARLAAILREIARGGLAAVLAGGLVGGLGGRLLMRVAALLNPDATGRLTENGEVVGAITLNGTLALIIFGGLLGGMAAGIVWVVVSPWLPGRGRTRGLLAAGVTLGLGGSFLVRSNNTDFLVLEPDPLLVALLLGLVALIGAATAWFDEALERRLRRPGPNPWPSIGAYGLVVALGTLALPIVLEAYFSFELSPNPPVWVGRSIAVVGGLTVLAWVLRLVAGTRPPPALATAGRIALVVAVVAGLAHLGPEVARIVGKG
jgi:MFS family permease